jgi:hypothetical protein
MLDSFFSYATQLPLKQKVMIKKETVQDAWQSTNTSYSSSPSPLPPPSFFFFFGTASYYVAKAGLKLTILLPQPSECRITVMSHHAWLIILLKCLHCSFLAG